ncbi:hypothetical protein [Streptomyces sp. E2N166]|uniref:hypothetical protein n=1 Tax=Streptomyces sp. E2N166 TaxID=1851909 RepID=UPI000EF7116B|nr:hypothetical protein [Streptomyces sp. E2N166]
MHDLIHRIAHWLGPLFGPGTGTHRAGSAQRPRTLPSTAPARLPLHHSPYCRHHPLDGADSRLVRPYLAAREQEADRDRQRHRRLALVLAADFGIDLDQHVVGARKAAA